MHEVNKFLVGLCFLLGGWAQWRAWKKLRTEIDADIDAGVLPYDTNWLYEFALRQRNYTLIAGSVVLGFFGYDAIGHLLGDRPYNAQFIQQDVVDMINAYFFSGLLLTKFVFAKFLQFALVAVGIYGLAEHGRWISIDLMKPILAIIISQPSDMTTVVYMLLITVIGDVCKLGLQILDGVVSYLKMIW
jgi:hypothetical protein